MRRFFLAASLLFCPSIAVAQTPPSSGVTVQAQVQTPTPWTAPATTPAPQTTPAPNTAACPPVAEELYREGMTRMGSGQDAAAAGLFAQVAQMCPAHPYASQMQRVAQERAQRSGTVATPAPNPTPGVPVQPTPMQPITVQPIQVAPPPPPPPRVWLTDPERAGQDVVRAEYLLEQGLLGVGDGVSLCFMVNCGDPRWFVLSGALFAGARVGAGFAVTETGGGITAGQGLAINSLNLWGATGGFLLGLVAVPTSLQGVFAFTFGGSLLGTGGGLLWGILGRPKVGNVSLANSGALWGAFIPAMAALTFAPFFPTGDLGVRLVGGIGLGGGILGFTLVWFLTNSRPISREHVWAIDGVAAGGAAIGLGLGAVVGSFGLSGGVSGNGLVAGIGLGAAIGAGAGLGIGAYLLRDFDRVRIPPELRTVLNNVHVAPMLGQRTMWTQEALNGLQFYGSF